MMFHTYFCPSSHDFDEICFKMSTLMLQKIIQKNLHHSPFPVCDAVLGFNDANVEQFVTIFILSYCFMHSSEH